MQLQAYTSPVPAPSRELGGRAGSVDPLASSTTVSAAAARHVAFVVALVVVASATVFRAIGGRTFGGVEGEAGPAPHEDVAVEARQRGSQGRRVSLHRHDLAEYVCMYVCVCVCWWGCDSAPLRSG